MTIRRFVTALALLLGLSLFATFDAQAQNGLERFEKDIKPQLELKSLTYGKGTALGDKGFVLNDVVAVVPASATGGKDSTVKIEKVTVEQIDFDRLKDAGKKDDIPLFAKLKIEGMTGDDDLSGMFESYGIPKAPVDVALDYRLDPASKVLTLSNLELALRGQGSLALSLILEGVSDKASDAPGAMHPAPRTIPACARPRWSMTTRACWLSSCRRSPSSKAPRLTRWWPWSPRQSASSPPARRRTP